MNPPTRRRLRIGATALVSAAAIVGLTAGSATADPIAPQQQVTETGNPAVAANSSFDGDIAYDDTRKPLPRRMARRPHDKRRV